MVQPNYDQVVVVDEDEDDNFSDAEELKDYLENNVEEMKEEEEEDEDEEEVRIVAVVANGKPKGDETKRSLTPKEAYRKRRRKIRRMLRPGVVPSFLSLITEDESSDDDDDNDIIRIDVDEYLGLKKVVPDTAASSSTLFPDIPGSIQVASAPVVASSTVSPADEGWYEGVVSPMAMAEDADYLGEMHLLVRNNLEFFSATAMDTAISQAGRRTPTVLGKVGLRCIHCNNAAKWFLEQKQREEGEKAGAGDVEDDGDGQPIVGAHQLWPPGSISYPVNIAGLYAVCAQKPQLHFEKCPNLPPDVKADFLRLLHDDTAGTPRKRQRQSVGGNSTGISAINYYAVAAKRIGLVDVQGGIRFGRDLMLEPLSIEAVRNQVEDRTKATKRLSGAGASTTAAATSPARNSSPDDVPSNIVERIAADPESESVLADTVAFKDDPAKYLARSEDKSLVTDYIYLIIRQMAICRAAPSDFSSRGKKTKLMRVGFAGFCCRHCMVDADGPAPRISGDFCCRSFSSAADNLASAIANSFVLHLQKCYRVPQALKKALAAYKRLHSRQMAQLHYGSQRRLFHALWTRLREADVPEEEMMKQLKALAAAAPSKYVASSGGDDTETTPTATTPSTPTYPADAGEVDDETGDDEGGVTDLTTTPRVDFLARPASFPVTDDPETQATVARAEEIWDPKENDNLILPSDRNLVSDYVFLTMRQLKMIRPNAADRSRIRKNSQGGPLPGMCCKFCLSAPGGHMMTPSGRSFPSAPDNMASALNTSLYNHMQNCYMVPDELKRAFFHLKKIHSAQCSSLKFGSQRRYFNLVFDRLRKVDGTDGTFAPEAMEVASPVTNIAANKPKRELDRNTLIEYSFSEGPSGSLLCQRCRMVPFEFRAAGSICLQRPKTSEPLREHFKACQEDSFDLTFCVEALQEILTQSHFVYAAELSHPLFESAVRHAVDGNEALTNVFAKRVLDLMGKEDYTEQVVVDDLDTSGLWSNFPSSVDVEAVTSAVGQLAYTWELTDDTCLFRYLRLISPALPMSSDREMSD